MTGENTQPSSWSKNHSGLRNNFLSQVHTTTIRSEIHRRKERRNEEHMTQGKVEICGVNTSRLPLLKSEEKEALFRQIEAGDTKARETYIEGNLRLVLSVIKR